MNSSNSESEGNSSVEAQTPNIIHSEELSSRLNKPVTKLPIEVQSENADSFQKYQQNFYKTVTNSGPFAKNKRPELNDDSDLELTTIATTLKSTSIDNLSEVNFKKIE